MNDGQNKSKKTDIGLGIGVILVLISLASFIQDPSRFIVSGSFSTQAGTFVGAAIIPTIGIYLIISSIRKRKKSSN